MAEQLFPLEDEYPEFSWDPETGICPPDRLSLWHTHDLATAIRLRRYVQQDTEEPIRVAIAGDTGLYALSVMQKLLDEQDPYADGPLEFEIFDNDPKAVANTQRNLDAYAGYMHGHTAHVFEADWTDEELWQYLADNPVHFLISNPPFLPSAELATLQGNYTITNPDALDGGKDGLTHVRTLLQHAPDILIQDGPTGIFMRYSYHSDQAAVEHIIDEAFQGFPREYRSSFRHREAVGPSSLGYEGLMKLARGDMRILTTASVYINPLHDVAGDRPMVFAADTSIRHAAALGGMILSKDQYYQLKELRRETDITFAEEDILLGGLHYLAVKMRQPRSTLRSLSFLPSWELNRMREQLGRKRYYELQDALDNVRI